MHARVCSIVDVNIFFLLFSCSFVLLMSENIVGKWYLFLGHVYLRKFYIFFIAFCFAAMGDGIGLTNGLHVLVG